MIYRISSMIILGILFFSCTKSKNKVKDVISTETKIDTKTYYSSKHLIEAEELVSLSKQQHIKIIDFRTAEDYAKNHINGAINIWRTDIEDFSYPYSGMMAKKERIEQLFSRLGIKNNDTLIVYDDRGSCDAARLWWVLKNYNFESVKILNGGLISWGKAGGSINNHTVSITPSTFMLPNDNTFELYIKKEEIIKAINSDKQVVILDTRNIDEFSGKKQKKGAIKGGRIPKSILIDWVETIDHKGTYKFKSYDDLNTIYGRMRASKTDTIITYCHSGVRSAHTTFVLTELLGYKNVKNYDGSWVEWSYFNDLPFEQDETTTIK
ncbi:sulfurtransferase [Aquimarina sp. Aq78]|uniref:sulfurtransferase n=1 Tax=Aquimarina sp. Aq78 TaxID=1191889 RepID=UPI000D0E55EF|nr:sulfurtransferase [Aquimarina sp. Aq78]